jgi:serine/threonine protein kinase
MFCSCRSLILSGSHLPLTSIEWQPISSQAKDLVTKLLRVDPSHRLDLEEILRHPWLLHTPLDSSRLSATDQLLGEAYHERMKLIANQRRLSCFLIPLEDERKPRCSLGSAEKKQKTDISEVGPTEGESKGPSSPQRVESDYKKNDRFQSKPSEALPGEHQSEDRFEKEHHE